MSMTDKLLDRLHLVRRSKYDIVREGMHKNGELCADLVEECQSQGKIIDELSDENAKLKEMVDKQAHELWQMEAERDSQCLEIMRLTSRLEHIFNMPGEAIGAAGDSDEMV